MENPKDRVSVGKWRKFSVIPVQVLAALGVAMYEGARKYGRFNWRESRVVESEYYDATLGHIADYWEGEDIDSDSGVLHLVKAMASLTVWIDAKMQGTNIDDRPFKAEEWNRIKSELTDRVMDLNARHPDAKPGAIEADRKRSASDVMKRDMGRGPAIDLATGLPEY